MEGRQFQTLALRESQGWWINRSRTGALNGNFLLLLLDSRQKQQGEGKELHFQQNKEADTVCRLKIYIRAARISCERLRSCEGWRVTEVTWGWGVNGKTDSGSHGWMGAECSWETPPERTQDSDEGTRAGKTQKRNRRENQNITGRKMAWKEAQQGLDSADNPAGGKEIKGQPGDLLGGPAANTLCSRRRGPRIRPLIRELDPTCHN